MQATNLFFQDKYLLVKEAKKHELALTFPLGNYTSYYLAKSLMAYFKTTERIHPIIISKASKIQQIQSRLPIEKI